MVASPRSSFETTRYGPVVADRTTIEWTEATWNPVTGCSKVSSGCKHCYAETLAERFRGVPGHPFEQGFDLRLWPERLEVPRRWRQPRLVFVNSMSDLFHPGVPDAFIADVFTVMEREHRHTFQVLTKRPERAASFAVELPWPPNVWLGTSIEDERVLARADVLRTVPAAVRFVSAEPLLGPLGRLDLTSIDWLIAGGESGPRPLRRSGFEACATDASLLAWRSSSSNGADVAQRLTADCSTDASGRRCHRLDQSRLPLRPRGGAAEVEITVGPWLSKRR
jgi:protein gp37